jgi:diguanylate cyclase (GGDEF)-like protein
MDALSNDTFTLLNVAGEEVNAQLKSMLYFMRYNFKALTASAFIYDSSRRVLVLNCYDTKPGAVQISEKAQIPFGAGVIGQEVASEKRMFMSGDLSLYPGGSGLSYYAQDAGVCSILAAPIVADSGGREFMGVLAVDSINKNAFNDHDKELMQRFSKIAGALIGNIKMRLELKQAAETFRVFYEVSHKFSIALKMEEIFKVIMDEIPEILPSCTRLIVVLYDAEKNALRLQSIGGAAGELAEGLEFSPGSGGIYSYAFNKCEAVNIADLQAQRSYRFVPEETPSQTTRSLLVLPMHDGEEGKCIGLFSVESDTPGLFRSEIEKVVATIIENASVAVARSLLYLKMEKLATTDGLTGLNNHRTFQEIMARELERAKRYGRPLSLLLTDIDHFKSFNDTYGHPVGDLVLREISGCIRSAVRLNDFPARYGGEEFAVVLPETDERGAYVIAERIRQAVEARVIESGSNMLRVTISIGVVTFPTYGTTQQEIIDCSDKALYASKKGGRNRVTMYNPGMTVSSK